MTEHNFKHASLNHKDGWMNRRMDVYFSSPLWGMAALKELNNKINNEIKFYTSQNTEEEI